MWLTGAPREDEWMANCEREGDQGPPFEASIGLDIARGNHIARGTTSTFPHIEPRLHNLAYALIRVASDQPISRF
uniref:Uncharacterized protein n=1 Tax=Vespula pensylvanica TaxID=30213 RepID=A0A834P335_VESPE|nr:hypothetical protein H0235_008265 [Vespula pensylvanica]